MGENPAARGRSPRPRALQCRRRRTSLLACHVCATWVRSTTPPNSRLQAVCGVRRLRSRRSSTARRGASGRRPQADPHASGAAARFLRSRQFDPLRWPARRPHERHDRRADRLGELRPGIDNRREVGFDSVAISEIRYNTGYNTRRAPVKKPCWRYRQRGFFGAGVRFEPGRLQFEAAGSQRPEPALPACPTLRLYCRYGHFRACHDIELSTSSRVVECKPASSQQPGRDRAAALGSAADAGPCSLASSTADERLR